MAIAFDSLAFRSIRRVRLAFSAALGAGAFSTLKYAVTSLDAAGTDEAVTAALALADSPQSVELALQFDLVALGRYRVTFTAVPGADASTVTGTFDFETPGEQQHASATVQQDDVLALLYGEDLVFDGNDFVEGADGDLAVEKGPEVIKAWMMDMVESEGLLWDADYAPNTRRYVDGTVGALPSLRGEILRKALRNGRIKQANAKILPQVDGLEDQATIDIDIALTGGASVKTQASIAVG